jgi:hypothetical protein
MISFNDEASQYGDSEQAGIGNAQNFLNSLSLYDDLEDFQTDFPNMFN